MVNQDKMLVSFIIVLIILVVMLAYVLGAKIYQTGNPIQPPYFLCFLCLQVFALTGSKTTSSDKFIRGMCFINVILLIAIIDTGTTYSFVSLDFADRLGLKFSVIVGSMVINTPTNDSMTTS